MSGNSGGTKFPLFCLALGFAPWLMLLVFLPIAHLFGCTGNEGVGATCRGAPSLSAMASGIFGFGVWGIFFTAPVAVVIFVIGAFLGAFSPPVEAPDQKAADLNLAADAAAGPLFCPNCSFQLRPDEYRSTCRNCKASFELGSAWRPTRHPPSIEKSSGRHA